MTKEALKTVDFATAVPEYARQFPLEMGILRLGGIYPGTETKEFKDPYTGNVDSEYFGNVGEHCVAVAYCADVLATRVLGSGNLQKRNIVRRALVHDATKRFEVMRKKAVKKGIIEDAYSTSAYETIRPMLEAQGVTPDIVKYMAHAGSETGHNSMASFVEVKDGTPILKTRDNLPDMIVHLADDMTHTPITKAGETANTSYLTTPERMEASDFPDRYPFLYKEGFGFDNTGKAVLVKDVDTKIPNLDHVKTYAEWQMWVAKEISQHLVAQMTQDVPPEKAEGYLKDIVNSTLV